MSGPGPLIELLPPALPLTVCKKIIDTIKGGTLLYIHGDDKTYAERTAFAGDTDRKIF